MAIPVAEIVVLVRADTRQAESSLSDLDRRIRDIAAGGALLGLGRSMLGFAKDFVTAGGMFEQQLVFVDMLAGGLGQTIDDLREKAVALDKAMLFSSDEVLRSMEQLAREGATVDQIIGGWAEASLNFAAAVKEDVGQAANLYGQVMRVFADQNLDAAATSDVLTTAVLRSGRSLAEYATGFQYWGNVVAQFGFDFEQAAMLASFISSLGVKPRSAGTGLRTFFTELADPQVQADLASIGIFVKNADGTFKDLYDIHAQFQAFLQGMPADEAYNWITRMFGKPAASPLTALFLGDFEDFLELAENMPPAADIMEARMDTIAGSIDRLGATWLNLKRVLGDSSKGFFRPIIDGFTAVLDAIQNLPPHVLGLIGVLIGLGGALFALGGALRLFSALGGFGMILTTLGALISPLLLVTAALGALAFVFRDDLGRVLGEVAQGIDDFIRRFFSLYNLFRDLGEGPVLAAFSALGATIRATFGVDVTERLRAFGETLQRAFDGIVAFVDTLRTLRFEEAIGVFAAHVEGLLGEHLTAAVVNALQVVDNVIDGEWDKIWGNLVGVAVSLGTVLIDFTLDIAETVWEGAGDLWGWLTRKLGVGTFPTGDGTGGPTTDRTVSIGTVVLSAAARLGGAILGVVGRLSSWLAEQLGMAPTSYSFNPWTGSGLAAHHEVPIGTVLLKVLNIVATSVTTAYDAVSDWVKANSAIKLQREGVGVNVTIKVLGWDVQTDVGVVDVADAITAFVLGVLGLRGLRGVLGAARGVGRGVSIGRVPVLVAGWLVRTTVNGSLFAALSRFVRTSLAVMAFFPIVALPLRVLGYAVTFGGGAVGVLAALRFGLTRVLPRLIPIVGNILFIVGIVDIANKLGVLDKLKDAVGSLVSAFAGTVEAGIDGLTDYVGMHEAGRKIGAAIADLLVDGIVLGIKVIASPFVLAAKVISGDISLSDIGGAIKDTVVTIVDGAIGVLGDGADLVVDIAGGITSFARGLVFGFIDTLTLRLIEEFGSPAGGVVAAMKDVGRFVREEIAEALRFFFQADDTYLGGGVFAPGQSIADQVGELISDLFASLENLSTLIPRGSFLGGLVGWVGEGIDALRSAWEALTRLMADIEAITNGSGSSSANTGDPGGTPTSVGGGVGGGSGHPFQVVWKNAKPFADEFSREWGTHWQAVATTVTNTTLAIESRVTAMAAIVTAMAFNAGDGFNAGLSTGATAAATLWTNVTLAIESRATVLAGVLTNMGFNGGDGFAAGLDQGVLRAGTTFTNVTLAIEARGLGTASSLTTSGFNAGDGFAAGIAQGVDRARGALFAGLVSIAWVAAGFSLYGAGFGIGQSLSAGIAAGIASQIGAIANAAATAVTTAIIAAQLAGAIRSPSRRMRVEVGHPLGDGIALGIADRIGAIARAAGAAVDAAAGVGVPGGARYGAATHVTQINLGGNTYTINGDASPEQVGEIAKQRVVADLRRARAAVSGRS